MAAPNIKAVRRMEASLESLLALQRKPTPVRRFFLEVGVSGADSRVEGLFGAGAMWFKRRMARPDDPALNDLSRAELRDLLARLLGEMDQLRAEN